MSRFIPIVPAMMILLVVGCATTSDPSPIPPPPLTDTSTYDDVLLRAREQIQSAVTAFYIDEWDNVSAAARGLERTGIALAKAEAVPALRKEKLASDSRSLVMLARQLEDMARLKDEKRVGEVLTELQRFVRELHKGK